MEPELLKQHSISSLAKRVACPPYDRGTLKTGIVHIGVGGFHRAHQAFFINELLKIGPSPSWGICGLGIRESDQKMYDILNAQDGLYTLITQHPDGTQHCEVIGSIIDYIYAKENPESAIKKMVEKETKIVSLTITEGGYNFNPVTGEFNFDDPDIQYDLEHPRCPKTVFGFLTAALKMRRDNKLGAFTILSCDNIQQNGEVARKMLLSFAKKQNPLLAEWIAEEVSFPNSMVDRITPVTPASALQYLQDEYSMIDKWPVVCEPFIQWIIEDDFCNGRPALEKVGVQFVKDVTPFEKMKIRLLNAGHSVLGIPGAIQGYHTIHECMEVNVFATFMRQFMDYEATPVLDKIEGIDFELYKNKLEERFANPNIKDSVARICSESSAKLPKFLIPTLKENLASGGSIKYASFILAAWCYYSDKRVDLNNSPIQILDVRKEELHQKANNSSQNALSFLSIHEIFGDLSVNERFTSEYLKMLDKIYKNPDVHNLMKSLIQEDEQEMKN